ncbi:MAG TPA: hypothetical protein VJ783_30045 [Pirellulales bacterium]|nr:hypothetical protein [Pirellulales bacterium]
MDAQKPGPEAQKTLDEMLGYLNFSSGAPDARFQRNLNQSFQWFETYEADQPPTWQRLGELLQARLASLAGASAAFRQIEQAEAVIELALLRLPDAYRAWHRDLLHHQRPENLFRPYFLARASEAVLRQGPPWEEVDRILAAALSQLNNFIGHRPVAVLRTPRRVEPYTHEWVAPVPLYLREAGVATGRYHDLLEQTLRILASADPETHEQAYFDLALLDEMSFDPRAYDFDHPVNKRPNYQFGQWDPHQIDSAGRYRRFVIQEITLEALIERVESPGDRSRDELLYEAGAVLAGTILMASCISGRGPETHDSSVTLAKLVPRIAALRDEFYERLLAGLSGSHGERLRAEAAALRQPFGRARQHLNARLAGLRARQLQHVHLAQIFARMGYPAASSRQAEIVAVTSARMLCEINGRLTAGHHALDRGLLAEAAAFAPEIEDLLERAIECGALVDPWNILGFQGQFSLFPAMENSVRDHRVDVLTQVVRQMFGLLARIEGLAAARGDQALAKTVSRRLERRARWWDQFATLEVSGVEHISGRESVASADRVAEVLSAWKEAGAASGNLAFWRGHVDQFDSPKSYALVVAALIDQGDLVASMALLVQWLGQAEQVPLADGEHAFAALASRWLARLGAADQPATEHWLLVKKFFDYLEANAETYWEVPRFELGDRTTGDIGPRDDDFAGDIEPSDDEADDVFGAAYEQMSYRDSTNDGLDASMLEGEGPASEFELEAEARRMVARLDFLITLARLWKQAVGAALVAADQPAMRETATGWFARAAANRRDLLHLARTVQRYELRQPTGTRESLVEYDRQRQVKESLLARVVLAAVETTSAGHWLAACATTVDATAFAGWEATAVNLLRAMFAGQAGRVAEQCPALREAIGQQLILYVPLGRGGAPAAIVAARSLHELLLTLLRGLPRLGLLAETAELIATGQAMERQRPQGEGAITEFDRLFETGYRGIVEALADAASAADVNPGDDRAADLLDALEAVTESLLKGWLDHSRSVRLSVLERVADNDRWQALVTFIERYGREVFTPRFLMNLGYLRSILHQGVDAFLRSLEADPDSAPEWSLLEDLDRAIPRATAVEQLTLVIEAVVDNYGEFRDFNSTTTQSDRGDLLHVLLDWLRLKVSYDRIAWNIRPVAVAHEVLVRRGWPAVAETWRRAIAERTEQIADWHLKRMEELTRRYGVRLPSVADHLAERLVRPLTMDRVRALVAPAIDEARHGLPPGSFEALEQELKEFTEHPAGSGLDVPEWLIALEEEVALAERTQWTGGDLSDIDPPVPRLPMAWDDVLAQLPPEEGESGNQP